MQAGVGLDIRLMELVGTRTANALSRDFGYHVAGDLLLHVPRRYSERGKLTDLASIQPGDHVTVMARVVSVDSRQMRRRRGTITEVVVTDGTRQLVLTFFRAPWRAKLLPGQVGLFAGKVETFRNRMQLTHPECQMLSASDQGVDALSFASEIIPIYPATAKVSSWVLAKAIGTVLDQVDWAKIDDPVPAALRRENAVVPLSEALQLVHRPTTMTDPERGLSSLRYAEALALQLELAARRAQAQAATAVPRLPKANGLLSAFDEKLPFDLTHDQIKAGREISDDLARTTPMNRLLQGEVGSGKTLVALRAMLEVVDSGAQTVLLAPTEVLALQHARVIERMLGDSSLGGLFGSAGTSVTTLVGSMKTAARRQALLNIASGEAGIVVGTHALLSDLVQFADLGLVVIDEQHRFGVEQRAALVERADLDVRPHTLVMTATPIPRTVAMTVFGDLDVSTIREIPDARQPVATHAVPSDNHAYVERMYQRIGEEVAAGRQVYVVCPMIEQTGPDQESHATVVEVFDELSNRRFPNLRVAAAHGRLSSELLRDVMVSFDRGTVDVLVATTVIEVGVDVPNATLMVVMDADRFGISQLHQLRGRVGRGGSPGLCLLVTSAGEGTPARARIDALVDHHDGFELSRLDLLGRGTGEVLGARQAGVKTSVRFLSLVRDEAVIAQARTDAQRLIADDPRWTTRNSLVSLQRLYLDTEAGDWLERS